MKSKRVFFIEQAIISALETFLDNKENFEQLRGELLQFFSEEDGFEDFCEALVRIFEEEEAN